MLIFRLRFFIFSLLLMIPAASLQADQAPSTNQKDLTALTEVVPHGDQVQPGKVIKIQNYGSYCVQESLNDYATDDQMDAYGQDSKQKDVEKSCPTENLFATCRITQKSALVNDNYNNYNEINGIDLIYFFYKTGSITRNKAHAECIRYYHRSRIARTSYSSVYKKHKKKTIEFAEKYTPDSYRKCKGNCRDGKGIRTWFFFGNVQQTWEGTFQNNHLVKGTISEFSKGKLLATRVGIFHKDILISGRYTSFKNGRPREIMDRSCKGNCIDGIGTKQVHSAEGELIKEETGQFNKSKLVEGTQSYYSDGKLAQKWTRQYHARKGKSEKAYYQGTKILYWDGHPRRKMVGKWSFVSNSTVLEFSGKSYLLKGKKFELEPEVLLEDRPEIEQSIFKLINNHRVKLGLNPLEYAKVIEEQARSHSRAMANGSRFAGHAGVYTRYDKIFKAMGGDAAGENVIAYARNAQQAFEGWLNSEKHRMNLEAPTWTHTGIGVSRRKNGAYIFCTQMFLRLKE